MKINNLLGDFRMKKLLRVVTILLILPILVSLGSCKKQVIEADEFIEIMEDKFDSDIKEFGKYGEMDDYVVAREKDLDYIIQFKVYPRVGYAKEEYEGMLKSLKAEIESGKYGSKASVKESGSGEYKKFVFKSEYDQGDDELMIVMVQFEKTVIMSFVGYDDKDIADEVLKAFKELGY